MSLWIAGLLIAVTTCNPVVVTWCWSTVSLSTIAYVLCAKRSACRHRRGLTCVIYLVFVLMVLKLKT